MKKLLLVAVAAVSVSLVSNAQINKGSILLGGGLSAGDGKSEQGIQETKNNRVYINPSIGVAIKTNLVFGVGATYSHSKSKSSINEGTTNTGGANLYLRKYAPLGKGFYLFGELNGGYVQVNEMQRNGTNFNSEMKGFAISAELYPGIAYAVNKKFHLEVGIPSLVGLSYGQSEKKTTSGNTFTNFKSSNLSFSSNVSNSNPLLVGFRIVLGK